ncbi:MAG: hypothetical protein ACNA8W_25275 [Bradymonadaceae bacterium]
MTMQTKIILLAAGLGFFLFNATDMIITHQTQAYQALPCTLDETAETAER